MAICFELSVASLSLCWWLPMPALAGPVEELV